MDTDDKHPNNKSNEHQMVKTPGISREPLKSIPPVALAHLNKFKIIRENCKNKYEFRNLDQDILGCYRFYKRQAGVYPSQSKSLHIIASFFEHISTANYLKNPAEAQVRITKLKNYQKRHGIDNRLVNLGINSSIMFYHMSRKDVVASQDSLQSMCDIVGGEQAGFEIHMLCYAIGNFLFKLLTLDTAESGNRVMLIELVKSIHNKFKFVLNEETEVKSIRQCIQWLRFNAFNSFRQASEGVIKGMAENAGAMSYYYKDPQEQIYPLLMMAKVKLDIPESAAGQNRYKIVQTQDIEVSETCVETCKQEFARLGKAPSARLAARLKITEAGLCFRKYQSVGGYSHLSSLDHISSGVECLSEADAHLIEASKRVEKRGFEEYLIALRFQKHLKKLYSKLNILYDEVHHVHDSLTNDIVNNPLQFKFRFPSSDSNDADGESTSSGLNCPTTDSDMDITGSNVVQHNIFEEEEIQLLCDTHVPVYTNIYISSNSKGGEKMIIRNPSNMTKETDTYNMPHIQVINSGKETQATATVPDTYQVNGSAEKVQHSKHSTGTPIQLDTHCSTILFSEDENIVMKSADVFTDFVTDDESADSDI